MGLKSNGCFVTSTILMGGHYKTYIISSVSHPRSDSVVLLVLWIVTYNIWGTMLYYKSLRIVSVLLKMSNISSGSYMRIITYKH